MQVALISGYLEVALNKTEESVVEQLKKVVDALQAGMQYLDHTSVLLTLYDFSCPLSYQQIESFSFDKSNKFYNYYEIHNKLQVIVSKEDFENYLIRKSFYQYQIYGSEVRFYVTSYRTQSPIKHSEVGVLDKTESSIGT